ncbi:MAG: GNAT family N-acetyltransferase [Proteobacteria bacterium]|nr:GNAT family N-acetyltransferase [Pseudomonadota bacterium]
MSHPAPAAASVAVRPSQPADIAAITATYAHHVLHGPGSFEETPPDAAEIAARRDSVLGRGLPHLAATVAGRFAGFAYVAPYRARSAYRYTVEDSVYVAADAQRQGVGWALLERLIAEATAQSYRQMVAAIGDSGNAGSIGLHARAGFRVAGTLVAVGFKFGRWVDGVLMQRPLGAGDSAPPDGY